ncbi:MAG: hypothetical protein AB1730_28750 [Myxococcota bacterium]|jgi:hypothetical protein
MSLKNALVVGLVLVTGSAFAQTEPGFSPPPLVPASPPPMPAPEPTTPAPPPVPATQPGTPPPPATVPPPGYQPAYSPYGQPPVAQKPGPEVGLMISESLFGMLTAAGIAILPYYLLFGNPNAIFLDEPASSIVFTLLFATVPIAVAQTQVSLANGSKYYTSEMWPSLLAGIGAQAGVLGLYYATGWLKRPLVSGGTPSGGSEALLLIGTIVAVPLIQMAVMNLVKSPRFKPYALGRDTPGHRVRLGMPTPAPIVAETRQGLSVGVNVSFLNGTF